MRSPLTASCTSSNSLNYGLQVRSITASKCISKLAWLWPPSASPNSLDYCLPLHLQTRSIMASECICKFTRLRPPCSHNHGLQVRTIMASKCISKLARSLPGSVCLSSLHRHFHITKMYFSLWKTPGVSERMWSVKLEASISGEYQTLGGYSGRPSE